MKRLLTSAMAVAALAAFSSFVSAGIHAPSDATNLETLRQMSARQVSPTDAMLAQCYGGYDYGYAPVYRTRRVYYPPARGGVNINIGGGRYRGFGPAYRGFGPGWGGRYGGFGPGFGPGFGRSGVGFFLNL